MVAVRGKVVAVRGKVVAVRGKVVIVTVAIRSLVVCPKSPLPSQHRIQRTKHLTLYTYNEILLD